jgi:hypothetical protein
LIPTCSSEAKTAPQKELRLPSSACDDDQRRHSDFG